jgi:transposase
VLYSPPKYKEGDMRKIRRNQVVVKLKPKDRKYIIQLLKRGKENSRVIRRAMILRLMDKRFTAPKAAEAIGVRADTAREIAWRYSEHDLEHALRDRPRPGKPPTLNEKQKSQIIAVVCSSPPEGYSRWNIRLIAEEVVKRGITKKTDRESIRLLLHSHELKPWRKKNVVCS